MGELEQDELAKVASVYIQRLVPYIADKRLSRTDAYLSCHSATSSATKQVSAQLSDGHSYSESLQAPGHLDPNTAYDPTQQETPHHHGASLGAACPAAAQKVPEFHLHKPDQTSVDCYPSLRVCYHGPAVAASTQDQSQQRCTQQQSQSRRAQELGQQHPETLPELADLKAYTQFENYKQDKITFPPSKKKSKTKPMRVHIKEQIHPDPTSVPMSSSSPVLVTTGNTTITTTADTDHSLEVRRDDNSICKIHITNNTTQCFPTESALKAKEKRNKIKAEQGISCNQQQKTNKINKHVQEHYDDCGSDFTPLQKNLKTTDFYVDADDFYDSQHKFHTSFELQTLYGPYCTTHSALPTTTIKHNNVQQHFMCLQTANDTYHSMELQLEIIALMANIGFYHDMETATMLVITLQRNRDRFLMQRHAISKRRLQNFHHHVWYLVPQMDSTQQHLN